MNEDEEEGAMCKTTLALRRGRLSCDTKGGLSTMSVLVSSLSYERMQGRKAAEPTQIRSGTNEDGVQAPAEQSLQVLRCPHCASDVKELLMSSSVDLQSENGDTPRQGRAEWFLPHGLRAIR